VRACRPTRPLSVTACGARNLANFSGFGCAGRQLMGQPLGGHPTSSTERKVSSPALVAPGWRATGAIKKCRITRAVMAGLRLLITRGRRSWYMVSVAETRPSSHGGWPVRRGVVAIGSRRCRPRALAASGGGVGGSWSAGAAGVVSLAFFRAYAARKLPACVHSTSRPTRPSTRPAESGRFWQVWCLLTVGAITLVGANPLQAGDGQLVGPLCPNTVVSRFTVMLSALDEIHIQQEHNHDSTDLW
jgi:hypothetical protein